MKKERGGWYNFLHYAVMMRFARIIGKSMGWIDCYFTNIGIASTSSWISQRDFLLKKKHGVNYEE